MTRAFVGLGSNVGDRIGHLRNAVDALRAAEGVEVVRVSPVYETDPVGPRQPGFLNAVAEVHTSLGSLELLRRLKEIESEAGRSSSERWGPREIDLDLLAYGDEHVESPILTVPHPRLAERAFVLVPLADLAPGLIVPGAGRTVVELLASVGRAGVRASGLSL